MLRSVCRERMWAEMQIVTMLEGVQGGGTCPMWGLGGGARGLAEGLMLGWCLSRKRGGWAGERRRGALGRALCCDNVTLSTRSEVSNVTMLCSDLQTILQ